MRQFFFIKNIIIFFMLSSNFTYASILNYNINLKKNIIFKFTMDPLISGVYYSQNQFNEANTIKPVFVNYNLIGVISELSFFKNFYFILQPKIKFEYPFPYNTKFFDNRSMRLSCFFNGSISQQIRNIIFIKLKADNIFSISNEPVLSYFIQNYRINLKFKINDIISFINSYQYIKKDPLALYITIPHAKYNLKYYFHTPSIGVNITLINGFEFSTLYKYQYFYQYDSLLTKENIKHFLEGEFSIAKIFSLLPARIISASICLRYNIGKANDTKTYTDWLLDTDNYDNPLNFRADRLIKLSGFVTTYFGQGPSLNFRISYLIMQYISLFNIEEDGSISTDLRRDQLWVFDLTIKQRIIKGLFISGKYRLNIFLSNDKLFTNQNFVEHRIYSDLMYKF